MNSDSNIRVLGISLNGTGLGHISRMTGVLTACRNRFGSRSAMQLTSSVASFISTDAGIPVAQLTSKEMLDAIQPHLKLDEKSVGSRTNLLSMIRLINRRVAQETISCFDPSHIIIDAFPLGTMESLGELDLQGRQTIFITASFTFPGYEALVRTEIDQFDHAVVAWPNSLMPFYPGVLTPVVRSVGFTTLTSPFPYEREEAREMLSLGNGRYGLITLGGGRNPQSLWAEANAIDALISAGIEPVVMVPPLDTQRKPRWLDKVTYLQAYPVAKYLRGFNVVIASSGMNSFPETVRAGVPTVFMPKTSVMHSDQSILAECASRLGFAEVIDINSSVNEIRTAVELAIARAPVIFDPDIWGDGNEAIATLIEKST